MMAPQFFEPIEMEPWELDILAPTCLKLPLRAQPLGEVTQRPAGNNEIKMEDQHPADHGCSAADAFLGRKSRCLDCPFLRCVYDERAAEPRRSVSGYRSSWPEIVRLLQQGLSVTKVATRVGVSRMTVYRIRERRF